MRPCRRRAAAAAPLIAAVVLGSAVLPRDPAAGAQPAAPNDAGVTMGHLHYRVRDLDANVRFWTALGGTRIDSRAGRFPLAVGPSASAASSAVLQFPGVQVVLDRAEWSGAADGSVLNHVAFRVPAFRAVEAAGLPVQRLAQFPGVGSVTSPDGERVELFEDSAQNLTFTPDAGAHDAVTDRHNRPLPVPVAFHHIHLYVPDGAVARAKAWYVHVFGGVPGRRAQYEAVDLPGVNVNFSSSPRPTSPTSGRMLDHIGVEVRDVAAVCRRLASPGAPAAECGVPTPAAPVRIVDPWGTSIELTPRQ